jgi:NAD(P)-dependent dehydrogenase (short-subunit alcohol dehydrogenase family)
MRFKDKVAIVTGAGRGIGKAIALALAVEGADLSVVARTKAEIEQTCREIKAMGRQCLPIVTNVSQVDQVERMVSMTLSHFKTIDIFVNNAAVTTFTPAIETTEEIWDQVMDVNLKGAFLCCREVGKQMIKQNHGKIVIISSIVGHIAMPGQLVYSTSKAGLLQITKILGIEWAKYNITVNAVCPGLTKTSLFQDSYDKAPKLWQAYLDSIPSGRPVKLEEVAHVALFLASSESDDIIGQEIIIDGGVSVLHPGYTKP